MPRRSFHDAIDIRDFYAFDDDDLEPSDDEFNDEDEDDVIEDAEDENGNGEETPDVTAPLKGD